MELPVYLDHAATTPVCAEVLEAMLPYFTEGYGNPATLYTVGAQAREAVEIARESVAEAIGADPEEIYFTSGGTESDNWAIKGMAAAVSSSKQHLLTTPIEHHAVLDPALNLKKQGYDVEFVPVNSEGRVEPAEVAARLHDNTCLVSIMHANNEIGTIQPVVEIGAICRDRNVPFHSDAVQSFGKLPVNVREMRADLLSLSAHKIYGPKGIGALYVRRGLHLTPFMEGGGQERGWRAGTLNVPSIVGFGSAVRLAMAEREAESRRLAMLRDRLIEAVLKSLPGVRLCGSRYERLPNNAHFCVHGIEGEPLLLALDAGGIYASAGSACTTGSSEPSHVLLALGLTAEEARGALRMTLGHSTTAESVDYASRRLTDAVQELRGLSRQ